MELTGLHLLLTYQCNLECDHCFVWSGPFQEGVLTLEQVRDILHQAKALGTVNWIYFEGGEPFQYYPVMLKGVQEATAMGFSVGIVSNGYWATSEADALLWLEPLRGLIEDLSVSNDIYHWNEKFDQYVQNIVKVAVELEIPLGVISIAQPEALQAELAVGKLPPGESAVMYRGRAAEKLVKWAQLFPWEGFTECPFEDLQDPGRVHLDPYGILHICQGVSIGNLFTQPLTEIVANFDPDAHPIVAPLLAGGPAELVRRYQIPHEDNYADACHLCYSARLVLRSRFPDLLVPEQVYGISPE